MKADHKSTNQQNIILATTSPYRIERFKSLGIPFTAEESNVDEAQVKNPLPVKEFVLHLARLKAESVAKRHDDAIIIGFDSAGLFENQILQKPKTRDEAFLRLQSLSGKIHLFYTGIYLINGKTHKTISRVVETKVYFRNLNESEINRYLDEGPRYKTISIGYDSYSGYSSTFVRKITGSYNNLVMGIPLEEVVEMLQEAGYEL
jgi:septum formation protein